MRGIPDRRDLASARRAARALHRGVTEATMVFEASRLELMRGFMSDTLRAVCLPLVDLQEAGGIEIDAEMDAMRPPLGWPWLDAGARRGAGSRDAAHRFLHLVRQGTGHSTLLALHVNGPSLEIVAEVDAGIVWTRHGRARLRTDDPLRRVDLGREVDAWCSGPPFAGQGYRISRLVSDKVVGTPVGVFDVGWLDYRPPWAR